MRIELRLSSRSFRSPESFALWIQKELRLIAELNAELIANCVVPPFTRSRVVYAREPRGEETFVDAQTCNLARKGDCAHLSAWLLGELWLAGDVRADVNVIWFPPNVRGGRTYHVRVRNGQGEVLDPSKDRGM